MADSLFIDYEIMGQPMHGMSIQVNPEGSLYEQLKDLQLMGLNKPISDITSQNKFTYKSKYKGPGYYTLDKKITFLGFSADCTEKAETTSPPFKKIPVLHFIYDFERGDIDGEFIADIEAPVWDKYIHHDLDALLGGDDMEVAAAKGGGSKRRRRKSKKRKHTKKRKSKKKKTRRRRKTRRRH